MESISLFLLVAVVVLLGFLGQWTSWATGIPSIVFLFGGGLLAGPVTGVLSPDLILGELLFPVVSALIGIILFEGGLTLKFDELNNQHGPVLRIIMIGGTITFVLTAICSYLILNLPVSISLLLGATLVVTGPTVVIPLLHQIRPVRNVGSVARWEGIIIDPIGAIMAVVVFNLIRAGTTGAAEGLVLGLYKFIEEIAIGTLTGLVAAYVLTLLFERYWIPDFLHNMAILTGVLGAQAIANHFAHESGLLAVTIMGIYMANQNRVAVRHILHFKEELRILFISILFVILVARLDISFLTEINPDQVYFLVALILLVRPVAILISTIGTKLSWAERGFLSWLAPRGIVAAAVASLFAKELEHMGIESAGQLDEVTFFVIAGTVLIYGFTLKPLSQWMGISDVEPQGILLVGAHEWARALALELKQHDVLVRLVDKNVDRIRKAKQAGLDAHREDVLTESEFQTVNIQGIGSCLSVTANNEVNTISSIHALDMGFTRSQIFQLTTSEDVNDEPDPHKGRALFHHSATADQLRDKFTDGWKISSRTIDEETDRTPFTEPDFETLVPLIRLRKNGDVEPVPADKPLEPSPGDTVIVMEAPGDEAK